MKETASGKIITPGRLTVVNVSAAEMEARKKRMMASDSATGGDRWPAMTSCSELNYAEVYGCSIDDYFSDPVIQAEAQIAGKKWFYENVKTDEFAFYVGPSLGAGPSVFGAPVVRNTGQRPWISHISIRTREDLDRLAAIDIENTGIEVFNNEWKKKFMAMADRYPVKFLDGEVFYPLAGQSPPMTYFICDPLSCAVDLTGAEDFFLMMLDEPEFAHDLLDVLTDQIIRVCRKNRRACWATGDLFISSDYSPMISRQQYREFALPFLLRIAREAACPIRLHHCEIPDKIIDLILDELKPRVVNGFKAPGNDISRMREMAEKAGGKVYLEPYLDGIFMRHQSESEIYRCTLDLLELFAKHGGRFFAGAGLCDLHPCADMKKADAVWNATVDFAGRGK